jgi:diaminopimelate decarboxylase
MTEKTIPFSAEKLAEIMAQYPTPFHIYDEKAIVANVRRLIRAFSWAPSFQEYFAVKAAPTPALLELLAKEGVGADCSSLPELILADLAGIKGESIMFTSNDTPAHEFVKARSLGAVINLDDITHIDFLEKHAGIPEMISFRYNPGPLQKSSNTIIGTPEEAKYGLTHDQLLEAYRIAKEKGAKRFGLHTMVISNELNPDCFIATAQMIFNLVVEIKNKLAIDIELVNFGGGVGIPYRPEDTAVDLEYVGRGIEQAYNDTIVACGLGPLKIALELGRSITGPYGYLVAKAIHKKETYKNYIGLDACMANLMRPALYGSYHHITVIGKENAPLDHVYDVTGSLCENNDKFAINRALPKIDIGDTIVIHDAGAHGHAMGFNYNGALRCGELLLKEDGTIKEIRRKETPEDYFSTMIFD